MAITGYLGEEDAFHFVITDSDDRSEHREEGNQFK